ncbi:MAG: hypothetical protein HYS12_24235 [Planctomycetes bacterium]|nr:hypothetical protein [Planctomycetota bacterium]
MSRAPMKTPDITTPPGAPKSSPSLPPEAVVEQAMALPSAAVNVRTDTPPVPTRGPERPFQGLDFALVGVVLLFGFLAASFVETGSNLWLHLATGRLLAAGEYHFGVDPFTYTSQGIYWANPSWLSDWLLYLVYGAVGGSGLVLLKALLVTALAWALLQIRRRGTRASGSGSVGVPVVCTTLALLVMSPRLTLEPVVVSYLCLGLTLWLLGRPGDGASGKPTFRQQLKHFAPLLVLIALWSNLDGWFLLGPALVALFWLGERLQLLLPADTVAGVKPLARVPAWLVPASLAACLVNPHHVHVFALPPELSPVLWTSGLAQDARFKDLIAPVSRIDLHFWPVTAINLAAWGYLVLLALGLVAFCLNQRHLSGWRVLVWVAFAGLSLCRMRTVPFFAVVAGPITVLELQDFLARRAARRPTPRLGKRPAGGAVLLTAGVALLVLAWFGWLQGLYREVRRPAWEVQPDPSLRRVAQTVRRWRDEGKLTADDRAFPLHPDVANYLVWFCPDEKVFLDGRLTLSATTASEYATACRELVSGLDLREEDGLSLMNPDSDWQKLFRERGITYLILHDPDTQVFLRSMQLLSDTPRLVLLHVDGQALLYGWRGSRASGSRHFAGLEFNANRLAFGRPDEEDLPPAPGEGPGREPRVRPEWTHRGRPGSAPTWESAAATTFLHAFEDRARHADRHSFVRAGITAHVSLAMLPALPAGPAATGTAVGFRGLFTSGLGRPPLLPELTVRVGRPPALLLLAVRAARQALAANPDDANAYLRLGKAYHLLSSRRTAERSLRPHRDPLAMLRHIQAASALERALVVDPNLDEAHKLLGDLYEEQGYLDLALEHHREELRLRRAARSAPHEYPERFAIELKRLERRVVEQEKRVQDAQNKFLTQSRPVDKPFDKARLALQLGLARQALDDVLLPSQALLLGPRGVTLQIELALMLGRAGLAREMLEHEEVQKIKNSLGTAIGQLPAYEWLLVCVQAADGDYEQADGLLRAILLAMDREATRRRREMQKALSLTLASEVGARHVASLPAPGADRHDLLLRYVWWESRRGLSLLLAQVYALRGLEADLNVVLAVLALEWGEPTRAEASLERTLALSGKDGEAEQDCTGRHLAVFYLERIKAARKAP